MKYCPNCGAEVHEEAVVCTGCGRSLEEKIETKHTTLINVIKAFLIIGCIAQGWLLIPLLWCLPLTISAFKKLDSGEPIGIGTKICILLFVNMISGICLLCMNDN